MFGSFFSPAQITEPHDVGGDKVVLAATDLLQIGSLLNIVAFVLLARGMPKAKMLTTDWVNSIGVVSACFGMFGIGLCAAYHTFDPLMFALGATALWSANVSINTKTRGYGPDDRQPTLLAEAEFEQTLDRMREKNFSVEFDPRANESVYSVHQQLCSLFDNVGIPFDRVWGDGSVTKGTGPGAQIDSGVYIGGPTRPGFDVTAVIWSYTNEARKIVFEAADSDHLIRMIISGLYAVTFEEHAPNPE